MKYEMGTFCVDFEIENPARPGEKRVVRGGSYLCSDQYCTRYLVGSRGKADVSIGSSNLGFRLALSAPAP